MEKWEDECPARVCEVTGPRYYLLRRAKTVWEEGTESPPRPGDQVFVVAGGRMTGGLDGGAVKAKEKESGGVAA
jgi:hypothetical protein